MNTPVEYYYFHCFFTLLYVYIIEPCHIELCLVLRYKEGITIKGKTDASTANKSTSGYAYIELCKPIPVLVAPSGEKRWMMRQPLLRFGYFICGQWRDKHLYTVMYSQLIYVYFQALINVCCTSIVFSVHFSVHVQLCSGSSWIENNHRIDSNIYRA